MKVTPRGTFSGYTGKKIWSVKHPRFGDCKVFAPDKNAAMVAAAELWKTKWTAIDFYTACRVELMKGI